jgi:hypothetical protein
MFTIDANNNTTPNLPLLGSVSWEANVGMIYPSGCSDITSALKIFGNVVGGERIAGLVFIVQESLQLLQGFISQIDYPTGHFWVDTLECVLNEFVNAKFCGPN